MSENNWQLSCRDRISIIINNVITSAIYSLILATIFRSDAVEVVSLFFPITSFKSGSVVISL